MPAILGEAVYQEVLQALLREHFRSDIPRVPLHVPGSSPYVLGHDDETHNTANVTL